MLCSYIVQNIVVQFFGIIRSASLPFRLLEFIIDDALYEFRIKLRSDKSLIQDFSCSVIKELKVNKEFSISFCVKEVSVFVNIEELCISWYNISLVTYFKVLHEEALFIYNRRITKNICIYVYHLVFLQCIELHSSVFHSLVKSIGIAHSVLLVLINELKYLLYVSRGACGLVGLIEFIVSPIGNTEFLVG